MIVQGYAIFTQCCFYNFILRVVKMKKILLYVDQKRRDEYGVLKIAAHLSSLSDIEVKVSGKIDFIFTVADWKPNIIIYGRADGYHGDWLRCISNVVVICLNTEQGVDRENPIYAKFISGHAYKRPPANDCVDFFVLTSHRIKSVLSQWLPENKLIVTGSPRMISHRPAEEPKKVQTPLRIGVALGADIGTSDNVLTFFEKYKDKDIFQGYNNLQGFFAYHILEKMWLDYIIGQLSPKYQLIVRPRFCNQSNLCYRGDNIEFDWSNDLCYLFENVDLLIAGQSTIGIEAMSAGLPVVSVVKMISPGYHFDKVLDRNFIAPLWQPDTFDELLEMIGRRERNELPLSSSVDDYLTTIRDDFYGGNAEDLSVQKISDCALSAEIKGEAEFDIMQYNKYFGESKKTWVLRLIKSTKLGVVYKVLMIYLRHKVKSLNKKDENHSIYI
jgi:hypothetical protein